MPAASRPHHNAEHETEQRDADGEADEAAAEHVLVPPAFFDVARIAFERFGLLDLAHVVVDVAELHLPEAFELRAVRIAFLVGERVMLAMDRHPFLGGQAGGEPQRELERELEPRDASSARGASPFDEEK